MSPGLFDYYFTFIHLSAYDSLKMSLTWAGWLPSPAAEQAAWPSKPSGFDNSLPCLSDNMIICVCKNIITCLSDNMRTWLSDDMITCLGNNVIFFDNDNDNQSVKTTPERYYFFVRPRSIDISGFSFDIDRYFCLSDNIFLGIFFSWQHF